MAKTAKDAYRGCTRCDRPMTVRAHGRLAGVCSWCAEEQERREHLVALAAANDVAATIPRVVAQARACGATWAEVAGVLGTSRQAAQQRYGS